jgi:hypothetical protein
LWGIGLSLQDIRRPFALHQRLESNFDEAACPRSHALTACIGFGKVPGGRSGDGNAADIQRYAALVRQRDPLGETPGAHGLIAEVKLRGNQLHISSSTRQRHFLRAAGCIVRHTDCAVEYAFVSGTEFNIDRAFCARPEAAGTVIRLLEWAGHANVVDFQDSRAGVRQGHLPCRAGSEDHLGQKGETGRRESYAGWRAHTSQVHFLGTAGSIIGDAHRSVPGPGRCGREGHTDLATPVRRNGSGTIVGLGEVTPVGSRNPD